MPPDGCRLRWRLSGLTRIAHDGPTLPGTRCDRDRRDSRFPSSYLDSDSLKIIHERTGELIAEGKRGWAITPFEGNLYISRKSLRTDGFRTIYLPGLCIYKFLYVWLDFHAGDGKVDKSLGWRYWLPNPLFPFIWFRVAVPSQHPDILILDE